MSGQGYHFAIDKRQADALLACPDGAAVLDVTDRLVGAFVGEPDECRGHKEWPLLHQCLSDGTFNPTGGAPPLNLPFLGGRLLVPGGPIVNFLTPEQVRDVAAVFAGLDGVWFRGRFEERWGSDYHGTVPEEDLEWFGDLFEELKGFYRRAADEGKAVVFVTDESLDEFLDLLSATGVAPW